MSALSESSSRRVETFRTTTVRVACQRGPPQSPKPSVAGDVATSPTAAAPSRKTPFPTASADARPRCEYPASRLRSAGPSSAGRICASSAAPPATVAAAPLVPLIEP